jgi:hypothetical protein
VEGFLAGFSLAPKPLKGVDLQVVESAFSSKLPIKDVLKVLTTSDGLSSWLGASTEFLCHVGIKFSVIVDGEDSKAVLTTVDLPRKLAFMVEALGEFEFQLLQSAGGVELGLKVRRALSPDAASAWFEAIERRVAALKVALSRD